MPSATHQFRGRNVLLEREYSCSRELSSKRLCTLSGFPGWGRSIILMWERGEAFGVGWVTEKSGELWAVNSIPGPKLIVTEARPWASPLPLWVSVWLWKGVGT